MRRKTRAMLLTSMPITLLLIGASIITLHQSALRVSPLNDLWKHTQGDWSLDGRRIIIRGDIIFEPSSDFRFNGLYLVDTQTPLKDREPSHGFWFGILITDFVWEIRADRIICKPFNINQATTYELEGTLHLMQVGKLTVMSLSDIDFKHSRQFVDNNWQPISVGEFELPIGKE